MTSLPPQRIHAHDRRNALHFPPLLGGEGRRVTTRKELAEALAHAHATTGRFQLIKVMLARGATSDTLSRFVAGFKAARERPSVGEAA